MRPPPLPHQTNVLADALERVATWTHNEGSRSPLVVFDLDATLYDNRPRTLEILMEYREEILDGQPDLADALATLTAERVEYLLSDTLRGCGVTSSNRIADITRYWHDRFFTDAYLQHDAPLDGASEYVRACHEAGGIIVYLTGRDIPGMFLGTVASLRDCGFPIGVAGTELVLKPDANLPDEAFKRGALPTLDRLGDLVAFFDNEPANCNLAKAMYPDCTVVLLETQKVPYAPEIAEDVLVVSDFRLA
ncbi:MAG: haloacid dehalogenase-like hydrolase [Myxococcota bacterium]|nr:haloacid dehalogenase-like hydrolase [Myxococcota bacterium]